MEEQQNIVQEQQQIVQNQINQLKLSQSLVPFSDEDFILIQRELISNNQNQQNQQLLQKELVNPLPKIDDSIQPLMAKMQQKIGLFSKNLFSKLSKIGQNKNVNKAQQSNQQVLKIQANQQSRNTSKVLKKSTSLFGLSINDDEGIKKESKNQGRFSFPFMKSAKTCRADQTHLQKRQEIQNAMNDFVYIDSKINERNSFTEEFTEEPVNWSQLLADRKFNFTQDRELYRQIKQEVLKDGGLDNLNLEQRREAWLLMLGIDIHSSQYQHYHELYFDFLLTPTEPGSEQEEVDKIISKDVPRTFADQNLYLEPPESGHNRLYNMLRAYSHYDPDIGYMQGMNFIAALVLKMFDDDALAWMVFIRILQINEWKRLYIENTPKLYELCKQIREYVEKELPQLHLRIQYYNIPIEPLIAAAFITIFANLLSIDQSMLALERFILLGEKYVLDTIQKMFKKYHDIMIDMDSWELQVFIGRKMYQYSMDNESFFSTESE